ncbi:GIP, partial [Symbiodinium sp. KB8]
MYIDNQAAGNLLNGSTGSWRTRHLRIRHSYVLDRVKSGHVVVEHIAGEDQPADLPTKMHSRGRLIHLLEAWGMVGLPELDARTTLKGLKLGCVFLLLLAIQSLAVEAAKDPLPATGTMELFLMLMLTCVSAVALWELGKAVGNIVLPWFCGTRRTRKIRKLRELARDYAVSEEEDCYELGGETESKAYNTYESKACNTDESEACNTDESEVYNTYNKFTGISARWAGDTCPPHAGGQFERERVVKDTLGLMTVQNLKDGLTAEGLPTSGIK